MPDIREYEVYNSMIDSIVDSWFATDELKLIVVAEHSRVDRELERRLPILIVDRHLRAEFDYELDQSAVVDFARRNSRGCDLRGSWFRLRRKCVIIPARQEEEFSGRGVREWDYFYECYPRSQGILRLSRVGFNDRFDQAVVYLENTAWFLAGAGLYVFLRKNGDGNWEIRKDSLAWMS